MDIVGEHCVSSIPNRIIENDTIHKFFGKNGLQAVNFSPGNTGYQCSSFSIYLSIYKYSRNLAQSNNNEVVALYTVYGKLTDHS